MICIVIIIFFSDFEFLSLLEFRSGSHAVQIVKRHHFASHLKRMAVVVHVQEQFLAFVKVGGAKTCSFSFSSLALVCLYC